ncbi:glycosyltransferase [uncultured Veillonella sp.]|uniref:glycosyltransferase n=1 Tax=uncultured Veillonella sp. TaxID=159268 RepID=UPI002599E278|nr:glycosyltransferase [uncultured Veillonella sp.]
MDKITVLMSVYNEKVDLLSKSINSILNQSYRDFIFLIILDNPQNLDAINYLDMMAKKDKRVIYYINEKNLGLPLSLNRGIDLVTTKYIARMDADDIAFSNRLEEQLKIMEKHPEIALLGTNIVYMDYDGTVIRARGGIPENFSAIKEVMKYENVFNHPTFMGKTEIFKANKYRNLRYSQDYEFTCRLIEKGYIIENINKPYLYYRKSNKTKLDKIVRQKVTKTYIQGLYKEKNLVKKLDLNKIEELYNDIDFSVFSKEFNLWERLMAVDRKKNKFYFSFFIVKVLMSKYFREDIYDLIKFYYLKRKYKF